MKRSSDGGRFIRCRPDAVEFFKVNYPDALLRSPNSCFPVSASVRPLNAHSVENAEGKGVRALTSWHVFRVNM